MRKHADAEASVWKWLAQRKGAVLLLSRLEISQSKIFEGKNDYQLYVRLSNLIAFLPYWEQLPKNFQNRLTEAYCIDVLLFFEAGQ